MNMLEKLSLENVEEVAVGILYSNLKNDYTALAQQV